MIQKKLNKRYWLLCSALLLCAIFALSATCRADDMFGGFDPTDSLLITNELGTDKQNTQTSNLSASGQLSRIKVTEYAKILSDMLLGIFDSQSVCQGGGGSGNLALGPALCGYLVMSSSFFSFFAYYIAAPCFVALLLWYFYTYILQLYRGADDAPVSFFTKRALVLLLALIVVVPASSTLGVNDSRPTAMWGIFKAVQAGMELTGKGIGSAVGWFGSDSANYVKQNSGGEIMNFLLLPLTIEDHLEKSRKILEDLNERVDKNMQNNPDAQALAREIQWSKIGQVVLGAILTVASVALGVGTVGVALAPALGMAGAGLSMVAFGVAQDQLLLMLRDALAEPVFNVVLTFAWYAALCVLVVRTMLYGFLGTCIAILVPMGTWGQQKIVAFFSNLIAFILTPFVMGIGWFVGLAVRALYLVISTMLIAIVEVVAAKGMLGFLAVLLACMTMPFFFIMPIAYLFFRVPTYLSHIVGQVFTAGMGVAERMRAPLAH